MPRDLHPKGFFKAEIVDHGFGKTDTGTNYFGVRFKTLLEEEAIGEITGFFYLTDKSAEYTVQKIRAMGYEGDDLRDLAKVPAVLQGRVVKISIEHREYQGEMRDSVASVYPKDWEPGLKKDAEAAVNVARFNALLKTVKTAIGKAAPETEDPIPF